MATEDVDRLGPRRGVAEGSRPLERLAAELRRSPATYAVLAGALVLQVVLVVLHGVNSELLGDGRLLALDRDANVPAWIETALFVVAGVACFLLAWLEPPVRLPLALLGGVALLLSFEQMAQLHEQLGQELADGPMTAIEVTLALGLIAIVALVARGLPWLSRMMLWAAIGAIAVAQGSSMLNSQIDLPYAGVIFFQALEEVGEITTAVLLIAAMLQPVLDGVVAYVRGSTPAS